MKLLTYLILVISSLSLSAQDWERVDGPYDYAIIKHLFEYNNNLYAPSSSDSAIYKLNEQKWEFIELDLPTSKTITFFTQKDSIIVFSTVSDCYLSTNYGVSWKNIKSVFNGTIIARLHNAEIVNNNIFAILEFEAFRKLYKYDIAKEIWDTLSTVKNETVFSNNIIVDDNYIYSSSFGNINFPNANYGLFISSDYGNSWSKSSEIDIRIVSSTIHKDIIFLSGIDKHIYKSMDHGETWEVDTNIIFPVDLFFSEGDNLYAAINEVGIKDSIEVGIHLSTDNGVTWEKRHEGIDRINIKQILSFDNILYCQNDRSTIFHTSNNGLLWEKSEILTDSLISYDFLINKDTLLVASSSARGLQYSTEEGTNWQQLGSGFNSKAWTIYKRDSVYLSIVQGRQFLEISKDYGQNWKQVGIGVLDLFKAFIQDVEYIGGDTILVATIFGTRITIDFGETWEGFQSEILKPEFETTKILRIDNSTLLIVAKDVGLFKSEDNGKTWENVNTNFLTLQSTNFETFLYNNGRVYAFLPSHGLFYSEDEGITWSEFNKEISEKGTDKGIAFLNEHIIVSTPRGVIVSSDEGKTSKPYEIDFADQSNRINDIAIQGDYVLAGSLNGIYRTTLSSLSTTSVESEIENNYLYTYPPYPLPAKTEVRVLFYWDISLPMTTDDINIYDLSGRKVETNISLRLEKHASYKGNLIWDCSSAQSGIYIINIKHGTEKKSVKVLIE